MPRRTNTHPCAAPDCGEPIPATRLMCRRHWRQLPDALRIAIGASSRWSDRAGYLANVRQAERFLAGLADAAAAASPPPTITPPAPLSAPDRRYRINCG